MAHALQPIVRGTDPLEPRPVLLPSSGFWTLPRGPHISRHLTALSSNTQLPADHLRIAFWALICVGSLEALATEIGWTRRQLEYAAMVYLSELMPIEGAAHVSLKRLAWCRIAYGIDPCWCER